MKLRILLFIYAALLLNVSNAQTFNGPGGSIPDSGSVQGMYPINVNGIGNINNNLGLASVCININHTWVSDLEIYLKAPDGTMVPLSIQNGGSGDDYTGTCFSGTATTPLEDGTAPFNGSFIPDGYLGMVNNGQNADGIWTLVIKDIAATQTGSLINWSISFSNVLPPAPPACNGNLQPANTCDSATPVCSFFGFCGFTSSSYTADSWPELDNAFCGTVQNNAFVKFVATGPDMIFNIWVTSSTNHDGIQMFFYDGGCGAGAVTEYGCYSPIRPGSSPNIISANGLTTGNIYYLMIDGYAGDECNYVIEPYQAIGALAVTASSPSICIGKSVELTATGGNGNYSWSGPNLNINTGNIVIASPVSLQTYSVSSFDPGGLCPVTRQVDVDIIRLPASPTVPDTLSYCQGSAALPLTATGTDLLWYYSMIGGNGSQQAIIPSTLNAGIDTYYVSQTLVCESQRSPIYVKIKESPFLGPDVRQTVCYGNVVDLTNIFNVNGLQSEWKFNGTVINPPFAAGTSGTYQINVTNNNGCTDSASINLIIEPPLHVFINPDTLAIKGIPFQLHCSSASAYSWSPSSLLNFSNIQNPVATISNDQQFIVRVSDAAGCTGSDSILVKIYNGNTYYIPNAFSPNADGINDIFRAIPVGIDHTEIFRVLNRYGKPVFESTDPYHKGWDGTYLGIKQSAGTYVWFINGIDKNGKKIEMRGSVILIQ